MTMLRDFGLDWRDRRFIKALITKQRVWIVVEDEETEDLWLGRGVSQWCYTSPSEHLLKEALEGMEDVDHVSVGRE